MSVVASKSLHSEIHVPSVERRSSAYPLGAAIAVLLASGPLAAQESADGRPKEGVLQEITVTAQKRSENLQDVALSMSAISGADLEAKGAAGFRDWSTYVPGLTMYQGTSANRRAGPTAVLRGVSQTGAGQLHEVSSQATTSYTIGQIPIFSGDPGLFDIQRIEVLRGPQGTLYGIASMGGTIRFIPNPARTDRFAADVAFNGGTITEGSNTYDFSGMVNLPIVQDKLALRFAGIYSKSDGYIDVYKLPLSATNPNNISVSGGLFDPRSIDGADIIKDANKTETTGGRVSVTFTPTDKLSFNAFGMWQKSTQDMKQAIDFNDRSGEWVASRFALEPQSDQFKIASLEASWDLGFSRLEYVGGHFDSDLSETIDVTTLITTFLNGTGANTAKTTLDADGPGGLPADGYWPGTTQFPFTSNTRITSNELRLQREQVPLPFGLFGSQSTFDYVLGVFKMTENREGHWAIANPGWNANRGPNTVPILTQGGLITGQQGGGTYDSKAAFADVAFNLTDKFTVEGGVRYSDNHRDSELHGYGDSGSGRAANGATVGDNLSGPGTVSSGQRSANSLTPRYSLKYRFDDQRMIYMTAAKGDRMPTSYANPTFWQTPGTPQNPVCQDLAHTLGIYDAAINGTTTDTVWSYDLGLRSTWLDRRLLVNAAVYHLDWTNLQRNVQMSQFSAQCNILIATNVGKVKVDGFELELTYVPIDAIAFNAAVGYTKAEVGETVPGVADSLGQPLQKGDSIENVAPWTVATGLEYRFGMKFLEDLTSGGNYQGYARVDWRYTAQRLGTNVGDKASLEADPIRSRFISEPYSLTDLRIGMNGDKGWSGSVYVSNLFNKRAMFESFRQTWLPNQRIISVSRPRTVGVQIKKSF
jgi:outer membrane receptor protein involved in Fe transport